MVIEVLQPLYAQSYEGLTCYRTGIWIATFGHVCTPIVFQVYSLGATRILTLALNNIPQP